MLKAASTVQLLLDRNYLSHKSPPISSVLFTPANRLIRVGFIPTKLVVSLFVYPGVQVVSVTHEQNTLSLQFPTHLLPIVTACTVR